MPFLFFFSEVNGRLFVRSGIRLSSIQSGMSLTLNAKQTALVLIDLEHGIVSRDLAPYKGSEIVERCARLAADVRAAGGTVVYVHVLLHELLPPRADKPFGGPNQTPPPPEMSDLVPEAGYQPGKDVLITKRQWGAFHATNLDQALRRRGITTIIMGGIATNLGVESTARAAMEHGYALVFAEDAMTTFSAAMQDFATKQLFPLMGYVRSTEEVSSALKS